jgi:ATP-dependent Lon protease
MDDAMQDPTEAQSQAEGMSLDDMLNKHFGGKVVRKDLTKLIKEGANVPVVCP